MSSFFEASAAQFRALTELRINLFLILSKPPYGITQEKPPADTHGLRTLDFLMRHLRHLGKFFRRIQQLSVTNFVTLTSCSDLVLYAWSKVVQATDAPPALISGKSSAPRTEKM